MSRAEPGQILSTESVLDRSRTTFSTTPIEPFRAKGKAEEVTASIVGPITGRRGERHGETPLVGRDAELATLHAALDELRSGTRIGRRDQRRRRNRKVAPRDASSSRAAPDVRVLRAVCEEYEAFDAVLRAARADALGAGARGGQRRRRGRGAATRSRREASIPSSPRGCRCSGSSSVSICRRREETSQLDARFLRDVLVDVTARFLSAVLADAPLLLVVEDVDFLDEASADLLRRLSRVRSCSAARAARDPARIRRRCGSTRPATSPRSGSRSCRSPSSEPPRSSQSRPTGSRSDHTTSRRSPERSGGSPLFLFELLDVSPRDRDDRLAAGLGRGGGCRGGRSALSSDRTVLRYASVLGVRFDEALLAAALPDWVEVDDAVWAAAGRADRARHRRRPAFSQRARPGGRLRRSRVSPPARAARAGGGDDRGKPRHRLRRRRRRSRSISSRRSAATRRGTTAGSPATMPGRSLRTSRQPSSTSVLSLRSSVSATSRIANVAAVWVALGAVREAAGLFESSFDALRRATRLLRGDPVEQARVYALRTRARVRTGSYTQCAPGDECGPASRRGSRRRSRQSERGRRCARCEARSSCSKAVRARRYALAEAAVEDGQRADEFEALTHAYTALDGSYQMLGQPERAVHEWMSLDIYTRLGDTSARAGSRSSTSASRPMPTADGPRPLISTRARKRTVSQPVIARTRRSPRPTSASCS